MDMDHTGRCLRLAFLMTTVFPLFPGMKGNYTHLWASNTTAWDSAIRNSTSRHQSESSMNPAAPTADYKVDSTNRPAESRSVSLTPTFAQKLSTLHATRNSSLPVDDIESTRKSHGEIFKKEVCEENNNNTAMLICLIIIAVLFLICTLLFLSTVVLANKVSSLRRSKQAGKRQPRSNGDFLASSGLWPAESDTWKRAQQLTGSNLLMQSAGVLTASRERKAEEGTENLTNTCTKGRKMQSSN